MLNETLRSRWFSAALHGGLWLLLLLAVMGIGGRRPQFSETEADTAALHTPVPVAKMEKLFALDNLPKQVVSADSQNAFATSYFLPPSIPVVPLTMRRVELTYQGYFETIGTPRRALMRFGDQLVSIPVGQLIVSNLGVSEAAFQTLTLTNIAGQTNLLKVNTKQEVEVPLK